MAPAAPAKTDKGAVARFALTLALWMTLTGSLGMLLQAVVRERANRALESLLASARPVEIVIGKLLGVGAVSAVVAASWLAAGACAGGGAQVPLLAAFADPAMLVKAAGLYSLGFAFYGLVTVAIGARARDSADAQNLARPMFAVLLMVFFATLAAAGGAHGLDGLVFFPPFTPFMLLMRPTGALVQGAALAILVGATAAAAWLAAAAVGFEQTRVRVGFTKSDR
jgi:ABC-2 type transport system permease protein